MTAIADVLAGFAVAGRAIGRPSRGSLPRPSACTRAESCSTISSIAILMRANALSGRYRAAGSPRRVRRRLDRGCCLPASAAPSGHPGGGSVAVRDAAMILVYDTGEAPGAIAGPIVMGACRGLNLLLGSRRTAAVLTGSWPLTLFPFAYIAAVTVVSRGEVHGGTGTRRDVALISLRAGRCAGLTIIAPRFAGRRIGGWRSGCAGLSRSG